MMYDEQLVAPMREDLTRIGFTELRSSADVDSAIQASGTTLLVVNSVCGCSARMARPAVRAALQHSATRPDHLTTVFAGQDADATARARSYLVGYAPSSPSIAILQNGAPVFVLERRDIEGRSAEAIAHDLVNAFSEHCQSA